MKIVLNCSYGTYVCIIWSPIESNTMVTTLPYILLLQCILVWWWSWNILVVQVKINDFYISMSIQKGYFDTLWHFLMPSYQKLGTTLLNRFPWEWFLFKMSLIKVILLVWYSKKENHFHGDWIDFWPSKLTLKTENVQFLTILNQKLIQGIKKSF